LLLEVFYYNRDYDEIAFLINTIGFNLFYFKEFPVLLALEWKIASKTDTTIFCGNQIAFADCSLSFLDSEDRAAYSIPRNTIRLINSEFLAISHKRNLFD